MKAPAVVKAFLIIVACLVVLCVDLEKSVSVWTIILLATVSWEVVMLTKGATNSKRGTGRR